MTEYQKLLTSMGIDASNITTRVSVEDYNKIAGGKGANVLTDEFQETYKLYKAQEASGGVLDTSPNSGVAGTDTLWGKILSRLTVKDSNGRSWLNEGLLEDGVDDGDIWKTILASLTDAREDVWTGAVGIVEGIADSGAAILAPILGTDKATEFAKKDLIDEQGAVRRALANAKGIQELYAQAEATGKISPEAVEQAEKLIEEQFKYMNERMEDESVLGEKLDSAAQSGGQLLATSMLGAAKVPWWMVSGLTSAGGEFESALNEGATYKEAAVSAAISGAAEVLSEKLSGGIKFGGKALDDALVTALSRGVSNKLLRNGLKFGMDVVGEGAEEVVTSLASEFGQWLTYRNEEDWKDVLFSEQAMDEKIEAFFSGALMGGGSSAMNIVTSKAMGVDATTGLTANEQRVVDKVYKDRVAEAEKDGKVTQKRKNQIYDEVVEAMDRGDISVETIEEMLGGKSYRDYKLAMDSKEDNDFLRQYDTLGSKQGATPSENAQYTEMTERAKQIKENRSNLQSRLRQEVSQMVRGDRLSESYNQKALRGVGFKVDLTKVDEKQKAIYQKAMDSGVINDSRRSHEFVDLVAKIASEKGVDFDFTNNERIKQSGFAVEGAHVNDYVNENGITINMQSAKALNTVVGHEITHVLEGTDLYEGLQKALFDYAKPKGEYLPRFKALQELYKDKYKDLSPEKFEAMINKEVTADLVGDLIFTDGDFVKQLYSGNRNIFEKIYDEIKYLCKIVTAGSREARQLEQVKKAFADAYRMDSTTESGMKYSLAEIVDENQKSYGIGVHLDSTLLDGLSESERVGMVKEYIKELGGESFAALDPNGNEVSITIAKANEKFKNQRGKVVPINKDLSGKHINNETKQEALVLVDELIVSSKFDRNSPAKYSHGNLDDNGKNSWEYWTTYIQDKNNTIWEATLNVANSADGRKILYDISPIKKVGRSVKSDSLPTNQIIADDSTNVNTQHSLSSISNSFYGNSEMSTTEFLESDYRQTEGYQNYVDSCLNNMRQTRSNFNEAVARKEIEESVDGIIRVALAAKAAGYDIYDDNIKRDVKDSKKRLLFSSLEPNDDYFTSSDISTICDKRQNFAEIYDEIVRTEEANNVPQGKRFFDNVDNYFVLHKIMADKGLTQPCRQCYVESMRKNLAPMANAFLRLVNETNPDNTANDQLYHQKGKEKGKQKVNNASLRETVLALLDEYGMSVSDLGVETLTTAEGLAQLKIQAPMIYEAFNSFYGQSKPKMPKAATPFRFGELTALLTDHNGKVNQKLLNKINSTGGFRLQSYSDFQIQNFTDVLQVIYEAGTLGLNGHAYTKVPAFLDATKGTNLKRNISIFMYKDGDEWKLDRNDSFPYTLDEIYDIVKSDRSGNSSIVAVSQNDDMSAWIMANDNVGYGIPFHKSGLKMDTVRKTEVKTEDGRIVKGYTGTKDHTRQQSEVWKSDLKDDDGKLIHKKGTKPKKGINIYEFWDFDNPQNLSKNDLIEQNLKAYIDACEDAGYLPKFRDYVMKNDKILNNVLEYAKKLGHVGQDATVADISFEYKGYKIPYGYHKFLVDFGVFTPDGRSAPQRQLSLKNYDFATAENFFADAETVRRNEILQQFANGEERQRYRDSNLTAEQLADIIQQRRKEVAQGIGQRNIGPVQHSLSPVGTQDTYGNFNITSEEAYLDPKPIAPVGENVVQKTAKSEPVSNTVELDSLPPKDRAKKFFFDEVMSFDKMPEGFRKKHGDKWTALQRATENAQDLVVRGADGVKPLDDIYQRAVKTGAFGRFESYMQHLLNMDAMSLNQRFGLKDMDVIGGVTAEMSRQEVAKLEKAHPEFKELAQDVYDFNRFLRNVLVQSGKITQETADLWEERYPHYIPIKRMGFGNDTAVTDLLSFMVDNMEQVPNAENMDGFFKKVDDTAPVKARKGSDLPIQPLFDTLSERAMQTYWAAAMQGADMKAIAPVRSDITVQQTPAKVIAPVRADAVQQAPIKPVTPENVQIETERSSDPKILDVDNEVMRKGKMNPIKWTQEFLLDNGMVFERLAKKTKDRGLEAEWNFVRNARGAAQHLIGNGDQTKGVKSLKDLFAAAEKTGAMDQFYEYLGHQRNLDGMTMKVRFGLPSNQTIMGCTAADSLDAIFKMNEEHPEFKALAEQTYQYSQNFLDMMVENGMIAQADADMIREAAPHWIPFNVVEGKIQPVFTTLAQETLKIQQQIALNKFGVHLKNTLGTVVTESRMNLGDFMNSIQKGGNLVHFGGNSRFHTMTVLDNGKAVTFEITDEMYTALKPTRDILSIAVPGLSHASTLRRNLITAYSPWFTVKNAIRDFQDVVLNSQHPVKTYATIPQAINEIRHKGAFYQEYVKNGGEQNTYFDTESGEFGSGKGVMTTLESKAGLRHIIKANNFIESVPRLAEYIASREAGASVEVAMLDAARVTTNFAAGGKVTKLLNRNGATFLNSSVQGALQQARNFAEAKQNGFKGWASLAARYAVMGLPVVLLNNLIWDDDEEYQELPDYITNNYYVVGKIGPSTFVRIPKGRAAAVIQNAVEQVSAHSKGGEADWNEFFRLVGENIAPNNPLEDNIFAPVIQVAMNKTWYGEDLVPQRLQKIDDVTQRFDEKTSSWSIWLANKLEDSFLGDKVDLSPKQIHYLLDQYSGVLGDTILPFTTPKAEIGSNFVLDKAFAPVKDIFTTDSVLNNRVTGDYYEVLEAVEAEANEPGSSRSVKLQNEILSGYNYRINELLQKQRDLQSSKRKDSEKYEENRKLKEQINALQEEALAQYQNMKITGLYAEAAGKRYNYGFNKKTGLNEWFEIKPKNADGTDNWYYQMEQGATKTFGLSPAEYWNNREEYSAAYQVASHYDEPYFETVKNVLGLESFAEYAVGLSNIRADKDAQGNAISGSRKKKVKDYIYSLNIPEIEKHILYRAEYNYSNKSQVKAIRKYLYSLDLTSYELNSILSELGIN